MATLRFLADENLKGDIARGLLRRKPDLDLPAKPVSTHRLDTTATIASVG
jgi:hypothetical protein